MKHRTRDMIIVRMRMKTATVTLIVNNAAFMQRQMNITSHPNLTTNHIPVFRFMIYKQSPIQKK